MSLLEKIIQNSVRLTQRVTDADNGIRDALTIQYGYPFATQSQRARWNCRAILVCGGCNKGRIPVKVDGVRTKDTKPHQDCQGLGFRVNTRYGRPV